MSIKATSSTGQAETLQKVIRVLPAAGTGYVSPPTTGEYDASLDQDGGTGAPVALVRGNTLSGTPVWTRVSQGVFRATLSGAFPEGKTGIQVSLAIGAVDNESKVGRYWISASIIEIRVFDYADNLVDGFADLDILIKVFQ
jgi:hypothetical protein